MLVGLALFPAIAHAQCVLEPATTVPLKIVEGFPVVAGSVGDLSATFVLDTGAQGHLLLPAAQARFQFPALPGNLPVVGTGGTRDAPVVQLSRLRLGTVTLDPAPTPVAPLPIGLRLTPPWAGLLGAPLLDQFDLLLDAGAERLALYPAGGCGGAVPSLGPRQTVVPLSIGRDRQPLLLVRMNGTPLIALLDTGSRATLLSSAMAAQLGLRAPISANTSRGVDGESLPVAHTRVRELQVGDDVVRDMPVSIAPLELGGADLLLGFDYLQTRLAFISFATSRLVLVAPRLPASAR